MGMEGEIIMVFHGVQPHDETSHMHKKENHMSAKPCEEIRMHCQLHIILVGSSHEMIVIS